MAGLAPAGVAAAAPGPALTLGASVGAPVHGDTETVTATATAADGSPAPDGTVVTFQIAQSVPWTLSVGAPVVDLAVAPGGAAGWLLRADGSITPLGGAAPLGDARGRLAGPAVALAATPSGAGYWVAAADGTVLAFGDAVLHDVAPGGTMPPTAPVVDLVPTPSGGGYWLLTAGGTTIPFGDAVLAKRLTGPKGNGTAVAMAVTPSGAGYWVMRSDGVIVAYGDAVSAGDASGGASPATPMVGLAASAGGHGYQVVSARGQVFSFGDAGNAGGLPYQAGSLIAGITGAGPGGGYWLVGRDGFVHPLGAAQPFGLSGYPVPTTGGRATLQFSSSAPATSQVDALMPDGGNALGANRVTVQWRSGPAAAVNLWPADPSAYAGNSVSLAATVTDADGFPVDDGVPVAFTATGTGTESPASATPPTLNGQAAFQFASTSTGVSSVTAAAGGVSATTSVTWKTADLRLWLSQAANQVTPGNPAVYTAEVDNSGGLPVPATLTFSLAPALPSTADRGSWACQPGPATLTCRSVVAANQASLLRVHVPAPATGSIAVTGTVRADAGPDENPGDDTASLLTTVGPEPAAPVLSQTVDNEPIGTTTVVTARSDAVPGTLVTFGVDGPAAPLGGGPWTGFAGVPTGDGYWLASASGQVLARGTAPDLGGASGPLAAPVVDLRATPTGAGYWLVTADGTVVARGDALDAGSVTGHLDHPIVGMAATASGAGYWLADSGGGIHAFGDAGGPTAAATVPPGGIVDIEASPTGAGFWLLGADGSVQGVGVRTYGDLKPTHSGYGTLGVVGMAASPSGAGYWIGLEDGGVATFGDGGFLRTTSGRTALGASPTVSLERSSASGLWTMAADGSLLAYGDAPFLGPTAVVPVGYGGTAELRYTATHAGPATVTASVAGSAGPVVSAPLPTTWTSASTGSVRLSPAGTTLAAGTVRRMLALVLDRSGLPVANGTPVTFTASGTGDEDPDAAGATTTGGRATFAFTSATPGTTTVKAGAGAITATTTVRWTAATRPLPPRPRAISTPATVTVVSSSCGAGRSRPAPARSPASPSPPPPAGSASPPGPPTIWPGSVA